jgi:hypothetical protein
MPQVCSCLVLVFGEVTERCGSYLPRSRCYGCLVTGADPHLRVIQRLSCLQCQQAASSATVRNEYSCESELIFFLILMRLSALR